jgi:flavodoxin I
VFEVIYDSKTGNTKKIAEAIALELGVTAEDVKAKEGLTRGSFVFLGSGCYAAKPGKRLQKFIASHDFQGRQVALFGTSGSGTGQEVRAMEELLKPAGAIIKGSFYCRGKMLLAGRGHPNQEELAGAREFAGKMKELEK